MIVLAQVTLLPNGSTWFMPVTPATCDYQSSYVSRDGSGAGTHGNGFPTPFHVLL